MNRKGSLNGVVVAGLAVAVGLGGGYWLGRAVPSHDAPPAAPAAAIPAQDMAKSDGSILYYKDPTGKADFSPEPKKDAAGRDYVAVYAGEEPQAASVAASPLPVAPVPSQGKRKILYYRNPMGLPDTSPVPKKDAMGMDYVPAYEGDDSGSTVKISPDRIQTLGVRTEAALLRKLTHTVRAVGTVQVDERLVALVSPKFEGYIETLHVDTTGQAVRRGEPLMEIYSPDLVLAQQEYLAAWKGLQSLASDASSEARDSAAMLAEGALQRLRNWDITDAQVQKLKRGGLTSRTLTFVSPANGVVLEKNAIRGQRFMPGDMLYRIADLSNVWVIADVFEQELASVHLGQEASVTFGALPGQTFSGHVTFIYPTLSAETRTVKIRIELPNQERRLKPALYGTV
ncbi:MAG TPA: efflux RND transporter periplasmic adaptor subunit, partial [Telmatospirillum sp.]|nr:efflux RND transporter periplasmic adaptor subunit [Telmatospirillum sp.]